MQKQIQLLLYGSTSECIAKGLQAMIDTCLCACVEAGADAIFAEAMTSITMYKTVCDAVGVPVLFKYYEVW